MSGAAEDLMLMTRENQALTSELIDRWLDDEKDDEKDDDEYDEYDNATYDITDDSDKSSHEL